MEFVEFAIVEDDSKMNLYVHTSDGGFHHVRDYDCYYEDYDFTVDAQGRIVEIQSDYSTNYIIRDGRLFEFTFNKGIAGEKEITLSELLSNTN